MAYIAILAAIGQLAVRFVVAFSVFYVVPSFENRLLYSLDVGLGIVNCSCKDFFRFIPRGIRYTIDGIGRLYDAFLARTAISADLECNALICSKGDEWNEQKHDESFHFVLRKTSVMVLWLECCRRTEPQIMANFAS